MKMLQKCYSIFNHSLTAVMLLIGLYWLVTSSLVLAGATQVMLALLVIVSACSLSWLSLGFVAR